MHSLKSFEWLWLFCLLLTLTSCEKLRGQATVIKVGERVWSFQELQDYTHFRLNLDFGENPDPKKLKKQILNEIIFRSLVENWAEENKSQSQKSSLTEEEKKRFSRFNPLRKALQDHKNYSSLYRVWLRAFLKNIPSPSLKEQKSFYNQNKSRFFEPARCYLKQILVREQPLAQALHKRLKQGEDFDELSGQYSLQKNPGWVEKGWLKVFDSACFEIEKPLSPVLKSSYGYHVFLVKGKKPARQRAFRSVQQAIIQILKEKQAKEHFPEWLKQEIFKTPVFIDKKLLDQIRIQYKNNET